MMILVILAIVVGCAVMVLTMFLKLKKTNDKKNAYEEKLAAAIEENRRKS